MSTFLGRTLAGPLLHIKTGEQAVDDLKTPPVAGTIFHSDLPYCFVTKQFDLTSYTSWSGGRKFELPQALRDYRANNNSQAYLVIMTDSSGRSWVHDPVLQAVGYKNGYYVNSVYKVISCGLVINGADYQTAWTASDAELSLLSQNPLVPNMQMTVRTWDSSDTHLTVFRAPFRHSAENRLLFNPPTFTTWYSASVCRYFTQINKWTGTNLTSSNLDVVSVKIAFLNIENSLTSFSRQANYVADHVRIDPQDFNVGSLSLNDMTPLISHGKQSAGAVTPQVNNGVVCSGRRLGKAVMWTNRIGADGVLAGADSSCVLEVPPDPGVFGGWDMRLNEKRISRNGVDVFNESSAAQSLFVLGDKQITFNPSVLLVNAAHDQAITPSASEGDLGAVTNNTVFLCSLMSGGQKLYNTAVWGVGDNLVGVFVVGEKSSSKDFRWSSNIYIYVNIAADGSCTVRRYHKPGTDPTVSIRNSWWRVSSIGMTLPEFTVRLVSLGTIA